ncbi:MAG: YiiX/YebB-like N1pC/P60 family cysteine hydrolase [Polyangiales bacterium]
MRYLILLVTLLLTGVAHAQSEEDVRPGDVVFHRSRSAQSRVIQEVTGSPWTHVGVVFEREGALWVLEAVQPVKWTRLGEWVRRGRGSELAIRRPRAALSGDALDTLRQSGERFLGRPYDARFEWDERRIYCSELVWLMFEDALGLRLSEPQRWQDLTLSRAARRLARRRLGRLPTPGSLIVTPVALLDSASLFDPRAPE